MLGYKTTETRSIIIKLFLCLYFSLNFCVCAFTQDNALPVDIQADEISFEHDKKQVIATGNVIISQKGLSLRCERLVYDSVTNKAYAAGEVEIRRDEDVSYGKDITYDFSKNTAIITDTKIYSNPFFGKAEKIERNDENAIVLHNGYITSCDLDDPHYKLYAKKITIYPGERIKAKGLVLKVGKVPVFYFPYISMPINDDTFPFSLSFGKSGDWGFYALTRWRYNLNEGFKGRVNVDYYEKRGWGLGITHEAKTKKYGKALFKYYSIKDDLYSGDNRDDFNDKYPERSGIAEKYLQDDRYKAQFSYNWQPTSKLSVKSEFNKFSDKYFMKDFFYEEYEKEDHPLSYILMDYSFHNSSLSLLTQKRMNRFYSETEYLPELEYNFYKHNIGASKFYFESKEKASYLQYKPEHPSIDSSAFRFYSHNTFSYSDKIKWLSVTPYVGMYNIYYSRNKFADKNILRSAPEMGITLSTKIYKYFNFSFNFLGTTVEKMRHILTPEIEYKYIHAPTVANGNLVNFDDDDSLARAETITFSLKNKIQAKNADKIWDFLYFSPSLEYRIDEEGLGSYFNTLKLDLEFYPAPNLSLNADTEFSLVDEEFKKLNADITYIKKTKTCVGGKEKETEQFAISLGQRYVHNENTEGTMSVRYRLTPKIQLHNYMRYDYNEGHFERQEYKFRTDMHCWWLDLGFNVDRADSGGRDLTVFFMFTLKEYPRMHFGMDHTLSGSKSEY